MPIATAARRETAIADCMALCKAYGALADAGDADGFAALFVDDGVFDRLGTPICGRAAIRAVIADRPAGTWSRHVCSNIRIEIDADGRTARGQVDLDMQRGQHGQEPVLHWLARYDDRYVLTNDGWRIQRRSVTLIST